MQRNLFVEKTIQIALICDLVNSRVMNIIAITYLTFEIQCGALFSSSVHKQPIPINLTDCSCHQCCSTEISVLFRYFQTIVCFILCNVYYMQLASIAFPHVAELYSLWHSIVLLKWLQRAGSCPPIRGEVNLKKQPRILSRWGQYEKV